MSQKRYSVKSEECGIQKKQKLLFPFAQPEGLQNGQKLLFPKVQQQQLKKRKVEDLGETVTDNETTETKGTTEEKEKENEKEEKEEKTKTERIEVLQAKKKSRGAEAHRVRQLQPDALSPPQAPHVAGQFFVKEGSTRMSQSLIRSKVPIGGSQDGTRSKEIKERKEKIFSILKTPDEQLREFAYMIESVGLEGKSDDYIRQTSILRLCGNTDPTDLSRTISDRRLGPTDAPCATCGGENTDSCTTHKSHMEQPAADVIFSQDSLDIAKIMNGVVCQICSRMLFYPDGSPGTGAPKRSIDITAGIFPGAPCEFKDAEERDRMEELAAKSIIRPAYLSVLPDKKDSRFLVLQDEIMGWRSCEMEEFQHHAKNSDIRSRKTRRGAEPEEPQENKKKDPLRKWGDNVKITSIKMRLRLDAMGAFLLERSEQIDLECTNVFACKSGCQCKSRYDEAKDAGKTIIQVALLYSRMQMGLYLLHDILEIPTIPTFMEYDGKPTKYFSQKEVYERSFAAARGFQLMYHTRANRPKNRINAENSKKDVLWLCQRVVIATNLHMHRMREFIERIESKWAISSIGCHWNKSNCQEMVRTLQNSILMLETPVSKSPPNVNVDELVQKTENKMNEDNKQRAQKLKRILPLYQAKVVNFETIAVRLRRFAEERKEEGEELCELTEKQRRWRTPSEALDQCHRFSKQMRVHRREVGELYCSARLGGCGAFQYKVTSKDWSLHLAPIPAGVPIEYVLRQKQPGAVSKLSVSWTKGVLSRVADKDWDILGYKVPLSHCITTVIPGPFASTVPEMSTGDSNIAGLTTDLERPVQQDSIKHKFKLLQTEMTNIEQCLKDVEEEIGRPLIRGELDNSPIFELCTENMISLRKRCNTFQNDFGSILRVQVNVHMTKGGAYGRAIGPPVKTTVRSINCRFMTKWGHIRGRLCSKRVDESAWAVVTPSSDVPIDCIGLSRGILFDHFLNWAVSEDNIAEVKTYADDVQRRRLIREKKIAQQNEQVLNRTSGRSINSRWFDLSLARGDVFPRIGSLIKSDGRVVILNGSGNRYSEEIEVGDTLQRTPLTGDVALLNRPPTLSKCSIQAFKIFELDDDEHTARINSDNCTAYNMDFDGDRISLHFIQSAEAAGTALATFGMRENIVHSDSGANVIQPVQDRILALYAMTKNNVKIPAEDALEMVRNLTKIKAMTTKETTVSELKNLLQEEFDIECVNNNYSSVDLVSLLFPGNFHYESNGYATEQEEKKSDGSKHVIIRNGVLKQGALSKKQLGRDQFSLVKNLHNDCGADATVNFFNDIAWFTTRWNMCTGPSLGIQDFMMPISIHQVVNETTQEVLGTIKKDASARIAEQKAELALLMNRKKGDKRFGTWFTNGHRLMKERHQNELTDLYTKGAAELQNKVRKKITEFAESKRFGDENTPVFNGNQFMHLILSGAKGSMNDMVEMLFQAGTQMTDGHILTPQLSGRTHPSLAPGDIGLEHVGLAISSIVQGLSTIEFLYHMISGRKKVADSSASVAEIGKAQRRITTRLINFVRNYAMNVVDGMGRIFLRRDQASSHIRSRPVTLPHDLLETEEIRKKRLKCFSKDKMETLKKLRLFERDILKSYDVSGSLTGEEQKIAKEEFDIMVNNRALLLAQRYSLHPELESSKYFYTSWCEIPKLLDHMRSSSLNLPKTEEKVKPSIIKSIVQQTLARIQQLSHPDSPPFSSDRDFMTEWYIMSELSCKRVWDTHKLTESGLRFLCDNIVHLYEEGLSLPGSAVGGGTASAIGLPLTQASLNVKHFICGVVQGTDGPRRLNELTSDSCGIENNIAKLRIKSKAEMGKDFVEGMIHADMSSEEIEKLLTTVDPHNYIIDIVTTHYTEDTYISSFMEHDLDIEWVNIHNHDLQIPKGFVISKTACRIELAADRCRKYCIEPEKFVAALCGAFTRAIRISCIYIKSKEMYVLYMRMIDVEGCLKKDVSANSDLYELPDSNILRELDTRVTEQSVMDDKILHCDPELLSEEDEMIHNSSDVEEEPEEEEDEEDEEEIAEKKDDSKIDEEDAAVMEAAERMKDVDEVINEEEEEKEEEEQPIEPEEETIDVEDDEEEHSAPPATEDSAEDQQPPPKRHKGTKKRMTLQSLLQKKTKEIKTYKNNRKGTIYCLGIAIRSMVHGAIMDLCTNTGIIKANLDPTTKIVTLLLASDGKKPAKPDLSRAPKNLSFVLSHPAFDISSLHLCNIPIAQSFCGIRRAEDFLKLEFRRVMDGYDIVLDPEHPALLASQMTFHGLVENMAQMKKTSLTYDMYDTVCYQNQGGNLYDLARSGSAVDIKGIYSQTMWGITPSITDNYFKVSVPPSSE